MIEGFEKFSYVGDVILNDGVQISFFKEGCYVEPEGWYPAKKSYYVKNVTEASRASFEEMKAQPGSADKISSWIRSFTNPFMDAPPQGDSVCFINDDNTTSPSVRFFDGSLLRTKDLENQAFKRLLNGDPAKQAFEINDKPTTPGAAGKEIEKLYEREWDIKGVVPMIQAAEKNGVGNFSSGKTDHDIIYSFIEKFLSENKDITGQVDKKAEPQNVVLQALKNDTTMSKRISLQIRGSHMQQLATAAGFTRHSYTPCNKDINAATLKMANMIYVIYWANDEGAIIDARPIFVDSDGYHYYAGEKYNLHDMLEKMDQMRPDKICGFLKLNEKSSCNGLEFGVTEEIATQPADLKGAENWYVEGFVAAMQAATFNVNSFQLAKNETSAVILRNEIGSWALNDKNKQFESGIEQLAYAYFGFFATKYRNADYFTTVAHKLTLENFEEIGIAMPMTPEAMASLVSYYGLAGFKVQEITGADSKLIPANLKYKNAIYGFGNASGELPLYNGLSVWAYIDPDGNLFMDGKKISPNNVCDFLEKTDLYVLDKISYVIRKA